MARFLDLSAADQRLTMEQTAAQIGWIASSVEKDFWVCWTLQQLFTMPDLAPHLTFKGGTSLSKAWGLIDRFSEDIDLTIGRDALGFGGVNSPEQAPSAKQQAKRLKALKLACSAHVRGLVLPQLRERLASAIGEAGWTVQLDVDAPDAQTLLLEYPSHFQTHAPRYVRPVVKIEFGAGSDPWPADACMVRPVMAEHFPRVLEGSDRLKAAARINILFTRPSWLWPCWARTSTTVSRRCSVGTSTAALPNASCAPMRKTLSNACWHGRTARSMLSLRVYHRDFRIGWPRLSLQASCDPQSN